MQKRTLIIFMCSSLLYVLHKPTLFSVAQAESVGTSGQNSKAPALVRDVSAVHGSPGQLPQAMEWFSALKAVQPASLEVISCSKLFVSGFDLDTGKQRQSCAALGEERVSPSNSRSLRVLVQERNRIRSLVECVVMDSMLRDCIPEGANPWSGRPDKKGRQATLKVVKSLPKELKQEAKGLSQILSDPLLRIVEFRGTDNRGISAVAALLLGKEQEKDCVRGMLVSSKFEE